jgi:hypothetical protein
MVALASAQLTATSHPSPYQCTAFLDLHKARLITPHLLKIVQIATYLTVLSKASSAPHSSPPTTPQQPTPALSYTQHLHLLELHLLNLRKPRGPTGTPIQETIALASLIYTRTTLHPQTRTSHAVATTFSNPCNSIPNLTPLLERLKHALLDMTGSMYTSSSSNGPVLQTMLWAAYIGAISSPANSESRKWYISTVREVSESSDPITWQDTREVLRRYLWLDSVCDALGKDVWQETRELKWELPS